ncbi:MAG: class I SAM-dependent methyltransferase [candidate division WOR-3 bacterium]
MKLEGFSPPFTDIAPYYDRIMSFVNYPSWISYIERILQVNGIKEEKLLDLACGTGTCLELWYKKGYKVIGLDNSNQMLEVCRSKFPREAMENGCVQLIQGDFRNFSLNDSVPIITCLYDSLNYLLTKDDLLSCFRSVYRNLCIKGIFIFDMNTIHALRDEWGNQIFERNDGPIHSIWANTFDPVTNISSLRLTINVRENERTLTFREFHQERAYSLEDIRYIAALAGFQIFLYRHLTFNPASERDIRIMGVARKL